MAEIPSVGHGSVGPVNRAPETPPAPPVQGTAKARQVGQRLGDRVELSEHARLLDKLRQLPQVRFEMVEEIRRAIADGTYETPEKLDAAIQRLLEEVKARGGFD